MTSFLGKLRQRAISQSTVGSRKSHHSAEPTSSPVSIEATATTSLSGSPQLTASASPITPKTPQTEFLQPRQIVPDINALFDSYSSEPETSSRAGLGLRPPRPRKRSQIAVSKTPERVSPQHSRDVTRDDDLQELPSRQSFIGTRASTSQLTLEDTSRGSSHRLSFSRLPPTKWSTFGRQKGKNPRIARFTPPASARHSQMGSADSVLQRSASRRTQRSNASKAGSMTSVNRHGNASRVSFVISHSPASTVSKSSSARYTQDYVPPPQTPSPPLTNSSRQNSTINTATHSSPSRSGQTNATSSNEEFHSFTMETPGTFGDSTPPGAEHAIPVPSPSTVHPELIRAVSTRQASSTQATTSVHAFPTSSRPPAVRGRTYPLRRQSEQEIDIDENTPVVPIQGRSLRGSSSLPRFQDVFPSQSSQRRSASTKPRSSSRRRGSVEWVARQASAGVTAENIHEFGWPAEVSREMIHLSLNKGIVGESSQSGTERGRENQVPASKAKTSEEGDIAVPCVQPCVGAVTHPSTSLPSPSPLLSSLLTSPVSPASTYKPRDDSSLSTQTTTFPPQIDTDLGAIELESTPRGDTCTLIRPGSEAEGEGDTTRPICNLDSMPAPSERARRHRSSLATTSGSSSTAARESATIPRAASPRTPRKSILNSPSQKFNTQSSLTEAGPSTPDKQLGLHSSTSPRTPATRPKRSSSEPGLSSVSETPSNKGKRKADDIEITPPDQKNGQRTTFALPENTRRKFSL